MPNQLQKLLFPLLGFPGRTAPALRLDGRKLQRSTVISCELDALPGPRLFPQDPARRGEVEEAERWGDEVLQEAARSLGRWAARRDSAALVSFAEDSKLALPPALARGLARIAGPLIVRTYSIADDEVRTILSQLPAMLDRVDGWIAAGVIGSEPPNAADFQLATSLRLLLAFADLREAIESRPAGQLALRVVPDYSPRFAPVFPREWLGGILSE